MDVTATEAKEGFPSLAAHQCLALPAKLLKRPVASVSGQAAVVLDAIDAVVSGV